jgi:hypothetical protein
LDQKKIDLVLHKFFDSLKSEDNKTLETGLKQNETVEILKQACILAIKDHPAQFEIYCKWFLNGSMYLLDEDEELLDIDEQLRLAR